MLRYYCFLLVGLVLGACASESAEKESTEESGNINQLNVSEIGWFFTENGEPFFCLGDTSMLLFSKLDLDEADMYLENRSPKRFNAIKVRVVPEVSVANAYGDSVLVNQDVVAPNITEGSRFEYSLQYDFWDHVDYIVDLVAEKGNYMAMVSVWSSNVKQGHVTQQKEYKSVKTQDFKTFTDVSEQVKVPEGYKHGPPLHGRERNSDKTKGGRPKTSGKNEPFTTSVSL